MDLNESVHHLLHSTRLTRDVNLGDTTLSLKCFGSSQKKPFADVSPCPDDGCRLVLGLGPTPTAYNYDTEDSRNRGLASRFPQTLSSGGNSILQLGPPAESMDTFSGLDCSLSTYTEIPASVLNQVVADNDRCMIPVVDEGSTSAKRSGGYMPSLLLAPGFNNGNGKAPSETQEFSHSYHSQLSLEPSSYTKFSVGSISDKTTTSATSLQCRIINPKKCGFFGCTKGARGASGLCIGHGGGQRCQKLGCNKGAESKTTFCKAHGGGRRCEHLGCTKSAEGKTDFCIAHGGGRRCGFLGGCGKAARGKSGLCIKHGGGKRCKIEGCTRSAEGKAGLCISHGGGRRCQVSGCNKGAQGSTNFCKAHGGGKRCIFAGCNRGAEGSTPLCKAHGGGKRCLFDEGGICPKSVHGGTNFCVAHGGGKRCVVLGCTKSARGRTDCCVKHGGGKRCKFEGCGKSAQGSTDFCKAHGGGKRCSWGDGKCEKFARGKSGLCTAHNSLSMERVNGQRGLIGPGLFHGLVSVSSTSTTTTTTDHSKSGVSAVSDCSDSCERPYPEKRQKLIPLQVLVPQSMKSPSTYSSFSGLERLEGETNNTITITSSNTLGTRIGNGERNVFDFMIPEERVHGGGLMSLLGVSLKHHPFDGI